MYAKLPPSCIVHSLLKPPYLKPSPFVARWRNITMEDLQIELKTKHNNCITWIIGKVVEDWKFESRHNIVSDIKGWEW